MSDVGVSRSNSSTPCRNRGGSSMARYAGSPAPRAQLPLLLTLAVRRIGRPLTPIVRRHRIERCGEHLLAGLEARRAVRSLLVIHDPEIIEIVAAPGLGHGRGRNGVEIE